MRIPLESNKFYHVYNRANGDEKLFRSSGNYHFFLKKYILYISPIADTYAYCLLPNHFHFLIKIKPFQDPTYSKTISKCFSKLFSSYTQAFNKQQNRMGSLFMKNFKRKEVNTEKYLLKLIHYIHLNPINHGYTSNLAGWSHNSYKIIINENNSWVKKDETVELFGGINNFIQCHENLTEIGS